MLSPSLQKAHDAVFVLTLPDSAERQRSIHCELGNADFEFVYGIDGRTKSIEGLISEGLYDKELALERDPHNREWALGFLCCALGHRKIYERIIERGIRRALIFEDDIVTLPCSEETIESAVASIPDDAELIYWGWIGGRRKPLFGDLQQGIFHIKRSLGRYKHSHRAIRNFYMRPYNECFDVASINFLAHAYTVSLSGAQTLLRWNSPVTLPPDHILVHAALEGDIRAYVSLTKLFSQRSADPNDPMESLTVKYS